MIGFVVFLVVVVLPLVLLAVYTWKVGRKQFFDPDWSGGYKTYINMRQYRQGKIPNKFTGQYHEQDR